MPDLAALLARAERVRPLARGLVADAAIVFVVAYVAAALLVPGLVETGNRRRPRAVPVTPDRRAANGTMAASAGKPPSQRPPFTFGAPPCLEATSLSSAQN